MEITFGSHGGAGSAVLLHDIVAHDGCAWVFPLQPLLSELAVVRLLVGYLPRHAHRETDDDSDEEDEGRLRHGIVP